MSKNWMLVIVAAVFEVVWVTGLKYADVLWEWGVTVIAIFVSFGLLIYSGKKLPTSTVYTVFVGLGTTGTVLVETVFFDVPLSLAKILLIGLLVIGVVGLKLVTTEGETPTETKGGTS